MENKFDAIVIGCSDGGFRALEEILWPLPQGFPLPLLIVHHVAPCSLGLASKLFSAKCAIPVKEAEDKELIEEGKCYFSPPNYHLLVEPDRTLALSIDEKENYSRPSIDVLFETAADVYAHRLIGVILTGSNPDGTLGLAKIKAMGGCAIVQDPTTAENKIMPESAIQRTKVDHILTNDEISQFLIRFGEKKRREAQ